MHPLEPKKEEPLMSLPSVESMIVTSLMFDVSARQAFFLYLELKYGIGYIQDLTLKQLQIQSEAHSVLEDFNANVRRVK
jgi:hypothetical protein